MQESSPLLLPSRQPNPPQSQQQHDDETNQNNVQQKRYAGRKKKKKLTTLQDKVADATRLLKEQIAKANIITHSSQSHGPSAFSRHEEQQSPESTSSGSRERRPPSPLSPTMPYDVTNSNETDSNSYVTTTSLFTSSESNDHILHHETRLSSPSTEVMDVSSPATTAVTDDSFTPLGEAFSSPPLEAMGYYSPPPMEVMDLEPAPDIDECDDGILLEYAPSPPLDAEPTSQFHQLPVHPVYPYSLESPSENKIDWGSDSEDEDDEDGPPPAKAGRFEPPQHQQPRLQPVIILQQKSKESSGQVGLSPGPLPSPSTDEAQETVLDDEEEEVVAPRTISESEVERLHTEKIGNLNGNYDSSGSFHEWHETLRVQTYGNEELLILPYTVIDF